MIIGAQSAAGRLRFRYNQIQTCSRLVQVARMQRNAASRFKDTGRAIQQAQGMFPLFLQNSNKVECGLSAFKHDLLK